MMNYLSPKTKVKKFGEVFTPAGFVFEMVMQDGMLDVISSVDKTMFDPAVGEGQYPCAELVLKMFYNIDKLDERLALRALNSLYGMDIQPSSVDKAREHLIATICDAYKFFTGKDFTAVDAARLIVWKNITCGDSLKWMKEQTAPQISLF